MDNKPTINFDSLLPSEMAIKAEKVGLAKASLPFRPMFLLAVLAGAFIALGAIFATTVATGNNTLPYGVSKLLSGLAFCLGLILVIVAGAELFTGNNLIVMAWAGGKVSTAQLLRNWGIVYLGNTVGAIGTAVLLLLSGQYSFANGEVGVTALNIAHSKVQLGFVQAVTLGILCNALVCLAVWLTFSARTTTDKILAIIFPITAFVTAGFEHSIANLYFVPVALMIKQAAPDSFWQMVGRTPADYASLTWSNFLWQNLLPVTIGNMIGGVAFVALVYWFIYSKNER